MRYQGHNTTYHTDFLWFLTFGAFLLLEESTTHPDNSPLQEFSFPPFATGSLTMPCPLPFDGLNSGGNESTSNAQTALLFPPSVEITSAAPSLTTLVEVPRQDFGYQSEISDSKSEEACPEAADFYREGEVESDTSASARNEPTGTEITKLSGSEGEEESVEESTRNDK